MNIVKNWGALLVIAGVLSGCGPEHDHQAVSYTHLDVYKRQGKDISIYINSPGGSVYAGLGIYDTMQLSLIHI